MTGVPGAAAPERRPEISVASVRHVHLVAVGGVGMGALAGMLKQRGFTVTGSDEQLYPPMSLTIERLGIPVHQGYRPENLDDHPDLVIIGNKVSRTNAEAAAVLARGIPYLSFPEALARLFIAGHRSLVVAGTHGKTTSTAMLAWVLERAGRDPSVMVGGESVDFGGNFKLGEGEFFVVEGDEYDSAFFDKGPKFLHYRPNAVLLTAVEFDHADIYRDLAAVKEAFRRLVGLLPKNEPLVVAADFPHAMDVAREARAQLSTFGLGSDAEWRADDAIDTGTATRFVVRHRGSAEGELSLPQPGLINVCNALGVYVLARQVGLRHDEIDPGLASFSVVGGSLKKKGEFGGVVLVDDFAHHPTAVAGTMAALRQRYPRRRLWTLFEPRSNTSRRKVFQHEYVSAFAGADEVIIGAVFQKQTDAISAADVFSPEQLVDDLRASGVRARVGASADSVTAMVAESVRPGDLVVMMSNGDFGGLRERLVTALRQRFRD